MNERATTLASGYTPEVRRPINQHFTRSASFMGVAGPPVMPTDLLAFSYARLKQGEADLLAGRALTLEETMNALRARVLGNRG